jgi:hypothetical protein
MVFGRSQITAAIAQFIREIIAAKIKTCNGSRAMGLYWARPLKMFSFQLPKHIIAFEHNLTARANVLTFLFSQRSLVRLSERLP